MPGLRQHNSQPRGMSIVRIAIALHCLVRTNLHKRGSATNDGGRTPRVGLVCRKRNLRGANA